MLTTSADNVVFHATHALNLTLSHPAFAQTKPSEAPRQLRTQNTRRFHDVTRAQLTYLHSESASTDAQTHALIISMAASRDGSDYGDELLAAMGFVDEFQFALSAPSSPELHVNGVGVCGDDGGALALTSLDELGSDDVLAEMSTLQTGHILESSPRALQLLSEEPALTGEYQQEQQQQSQERRKRPANANNQKQKTKKRKPSWDPNKARNERKGEIVYLHKQVAELEAQLAEMKAKKQANSIHNCNRTSICVVARRPHRDDVASAAGAVPATHQSQLCTAKARAWEDIAKNQLDMRTKAERENIRLKLVLENQLKVAKNLGTHVDRAASSHEIQRCLPAKQVRLMYPPPSQRDESDATAIVDSLVAGLEQSYAELDAVFEANGLAESETPHINTQMHSNSDSATHSLLLEVFATKVLPFDFDATVKAVWDHFEFEKEQFLSRANHNSSESDSVSLEQPQCSIIKNFHLKLQAKGTTANFGVKQVIRRYDEQERVVIVWRSFFDPIESSCDEPLTDVRFLEKGYVVIKKPATISDSFTLLQPCFIITPIFSEQQNGEGYHHHHQSPLPTGTMADFIFATTVANIRTSHQMIVDTLLQQAMMVN